MWVISMLMTTIGSGLNMLFSLRSPSITITSYVAQLIVYPVGLAWDKVMPNRQHTTFGVKWNLNPGPFNFKEHAMIVIMANASFGNGAGYFTDILQVNFNHPIFYVFALLIQNNKNRRKEAFTNLTGDGGSVSSLL
jgi:hypothetical protein